MDEKHKLIIQINFTELVNRCDINKLLPKLIENGVFSQRITEQYMNFNETELDRKRKLFLDIPRRGPEAFDKLLLALKSVGDINHITVACLLEGKEVPEPPKAVVKRPKDLAIGPLLGVIEELDNLKTGSHPYNLSENQRPLHIRQLSQESPNLTISLVDEPIKIFVRKSEEFMDVFDSIPPTYTMRSKCRGAYLGINNMEFVNDVAAYRTGAQIDEENLKELFKQMGFNINNYRNQSKYDMMNTIKSFTDVRRNPILKKADCLVIAIMSHGNEGACKEDSYVTTADGQDLPVSWILDQFNNYHCPEFVNKPKIFIFQICRGTNLNPSLTLPSRIEADGVNITPNHEIRIMTDMLVAFSTLPGDRAYRDKYLGTWYIQLICEIFMKHAYNTEVEHLLKMVDNHLRYYKSACGNMQTSCYENRGFKRCFLNPGLYE